MAEPPLDHTADVHADVCVIGAGPAGSSIARHLAEGGASIVVLESGAATADASAQALNQLVLDSPDFESPNESRRRQFGGMSVDWNNYIGPNRLQAARFVRYDPLDFEERDWVPNSGWPISYEDLEPFYARAQAMCGLSRFDNRPDPWISADRPAFVSSSGVLVTSIDQQGLRHVFGDDMLRVLARRANVRLCLMSTVDRLMRDRESMRIVAARVRRPDGSTYVVRARAFVIAAGAIETARLLLLSNDIEAAGIGNRHDNVGRFYMDHPRVSFGYARLRMDTRTLGIFDYHVSNGHPIHAKLKLDEDTLRSEHLLNGAIILSPSYLSPRQRNAVDSARRARELLSTRSLAAAVPHVSRAAAAAPALCWRLLSLMRSQGRGRPQMQLGWGDARPALNYASFEMVFQPEQAPDRTNRVTLDQRTDRLGNAIARLSWRWTDIDLESISRTRQIVAREIANDLGPLPPFSMSSARGDGSLRPVSAHHHMGTTRMSSDPRTGVVDKDCRVHGYSNLFVAGGSVLPTGGSANPTLTIVALALRLADFVGERLAAPA